LPSWGWGPTPWLGETKTRTQASGLGFGGGGRGGVRNGGSRWRGRVRFWGGGGGRGREREAAWPFPSGFGGASTPRVASLLLTANPACRVYLQTGGPNRRPLVTVYRSVSRGNRCLPCKFKFSNQTASQSVTDRFTGR
jgi:hypothetical protein